MRDVPISNCEREFVLSIIEEKKRVDGRQPHDRRQIKIQFGADFGCCDVQLGKTRVLAQVSSEVTTPKLQRPNEGTLYINVELSPMAHPSFEQGRQTEETVELSRLLERCLKESRCVDLESLCIVAGEKVWSLRTDITILNHEGNMLDCASVAAIAALAHFRRPDVTVKGQEITIHTAEERDPIPISVHHMPLTVTFSFFHQGKNMILDPNMLEEKVAEGKLAIGQNRHREICLLHMTGQMFLHQDQVKQCSKIAFVKVLETTELIREALTSDKEARSRGERCGLAVSTNTQINVTATETQVLPSPTVPSDSDSDSGSQPEMKAEPFEGSDEDTPKVVGEGVAILGRSAVKKWEEEEEMEKEPKGDKQAETARKPKAKGKKRK